MKKANTYRLIKEANTYLLLNTIREYEPVTIEECITKTHLSRPTVLNALDNLMKNNLIKKAGFGESVCGRQPNLYALDLESYFAIGIDLEFPPVRIVFSDIKGGIIYSKEWMHDSEDSIADIEQRILSEIQTGMENYHLTTDMIAGVGLGVGGIANIHTNMPIFLPRVHDDRLENFGKSLEEFLKVPVQIRNDAHLVALAERFSSKINEDFIYVAYRSGIGSAIFVNGQLFSGQFGNPGYMGHTTIDEKGETCVCGNKGCLEVYCSKGAIEKQYSQRTNVKKSYRDIVQASDQGDGAAQEVLRIAGRYLGTSLANMIKLFDISNVVLGYLECTENNVFFRTIVETIESQVRNFVQEECAIRLGITGKYDFALGGCLYALETFFEKPKLRLTVE